MKRFFTFAFLLCVFMHAMAYEWTDGYGRSWTFDIDGSNATNLRPTDNDNVSGTVVIPAKVYMWGAEFSVTNIAPSAFASNTTLYGVIISEGVTEISSGAFYGCPFMGSITIPASVTSIGYDAFYCNYALTKVIISDIAAWCNINFNGEKANPLIYAHHLYINENTEITNLTIPSGVTSISAYAFQDCTGLTSVSIPSGVTTIGEMAFSGCTSLTNASIPTSVIAVDEDAFKDTPFFDNQTGLVYLGGVAYKYNGDMPANTSIDIRQGTVTIAPSALSFCTNLTSVTIPESVTTISQRAFQCCTGLTGITIPESVTTIGDYAFMDSGLTEVTIPASVTAIASSLFTRCEDLTTVTLPEGLESIGPRAFNECSALTTVNIPSTVTSIGEQAFCECSSLTAVTIPAGVTGIEQNTFDSCTSLTSVSLPLGLTSIGNEAFYGCSALTSVVIPEHVTTIGSLAFRKCNSLTEVYNFCATPQAIGEKTFTNYSPTLYVLEEYTSDYQGADVWKDFNIVGVIRGDVNIDHEVDVADFTLTASFLLGQTPADFHAPLADVAGSSTGTYDGDIDIADLTGIANIILHGTSSSGE
ncbi:MAG: leucine-rich repeat protein [Prevotella sp.]|nr:leucine-rich repeat protein [Prevotella sp.]